MQCMLGSSLMYSFLKLIGPEESTSRVNISQPLHTTEQRKRRRNSENDFTSLEKSTNKCDNEGCSESRCELQERIRKKRK